MFNRALKSMREEFPEMYQASPVLRFIAAVKDIPQELGYEARIEQVLWIYYTERATITAEQAPRDYDALRCTFIATVGEHFMPAALTIRSPEYRIYCVALEARRELVGQYGAFEYDYNVNGISTAEEAIDKISRLIDDIAPNICPDPDDTSASRLRPAM